MRKRKPPEALSTERLETLVDGVFAVLMTLLVLDIKAPGYEPSTQLLLNDLKDLLPKAFSFFISFALLGIFWFGHRMEFHYVQKADRMLIWITMGLLLVLASVPFSAALLGNNPFATPALVIYCINMALAGFMRWLHWVYTTQGHRLVVPTMDNELIRKVRNRFLFIPLMYMLALALAFLYPWITLVLLAGLPFLYIPAPREDQHLTSLPTLDEG